MPQTDQPTRVTSLREVLADPPLLHGPENAEAVLTHGLVPGALAFIDEQVKPGNRTLETGMGLSTVTFALNGARHDCITPSGTEVEHLRAYASTHGISLDDVTFHVDVSERVLPGLDLDALDLVLIDGSHSFPQVFIDWFYTAQALKVGGLLVVDDVHVWTGRVLRDFLEAEPEWELIGRWHGRTVAFRKTGELDPDRVWDHQAYVVRRTHARTVGRARMAIDMVRGGDTRTLIDAARGALKRGG